jgi:dienelactone hydrolase
MKTKLNLLAVGIFLAAVNAGFGQSTLQFSASTYTVAENAGTVTLTVQRLNDTNGVVTVDYASTNGTATAGLDYTDVAGTLTFAVGETNQTISVPILNDFLVESGAYETFTVTLNNATGGAVLGTPATATVRITDNDKGLQFEFSSYTVGEGGGSVLIGVLRGDDGNFPVSVDYFTTDGTAIKGQDYTGVTNTLIFAPGDKVQTFTVPILNDGVKEANKYFRVTLSNPTNQVLGAQKTAQVMIVDNDAGVQFQPLNRYWIAENEGALTLTVVRGNDGNLGPFTVDFATSNLTATAGVDYTATNGTLAFAQGEMEKTLTVPILYDEVPEADKQFKATLSNPTNAVLGPYATATITMLDITGMVPHRFDAIGVLPDRSVQLTLGGSVHTRFHDYYDLYPIEVSSNLVDWMPLVTLQRTNADTNVLTYTDTETTNYGTRFYRTPTNHLITPFFLQPTGPYAAGVLSRLVTDPSRRNRYGISSNASFMVSVWYPAVAEAGRWPGPLLEPQIAHDPFFSETLQGLGFPTAVFVDRTPQMVGYALPDAPWATNLAPCPILVCSPEGGGWRASLAEKAANLASHGYVVVVSDPIDAAATVWPDGTYLTQSAATPFDAASCFQDRVKDLVFILDELTRWNTNNAVFAGRLDLTKVAAMGTCWGFEAAAEFCRNDPRCTGAILVCCAAAIWPTTHTTSTFPDLDQFGVGKPVLLVYADYAAAYYDFLYNKNAKDATAFLIQGAGSGGNGGMILVQDFYLLLEPYRLDTGRKGARAIADFSLWFLNKYLKGSSDPSPPLANYPWILGFKQK